MSPKVSVIIPVYNVEKYLRECLDSVVNQTLKDIEIICVDDGSTDSSLDILREYERQDSRVKVLCQKNEYAGVARNNGMKIAQGKYFVFLDSDDFFEPDLLEVQYNQCEKYGADIGLCAANLFDDAAQIFRRAPWLLDMQYINEQPFNRKLLKNDIFKCTRFSPWTKMFSAEFVRREQLLFQNLQRANDCYFVMSALALAEKIVAVDKVLVHYRVGLKNNLQSDNASTPLACNQALSAVKARLIKAGIYEEISVAFRNNALDQCLYTVKRLEENQDAKDTWIMSMKDRYLKEFDLDADNSGCLDAKPYAELLEIIGIEQQEYSCALSVVVAVYNVEPYLKQCMDSLICQTLKDIEIICVNDGSTDGSLAILNEYAALDPRVKIIDKKQNEGLLLGRKSGVLQAKGKYILYVDSDDFLDCNACQTALDLIEEHQVDILQFTCGVEDHSDNVNAKNWLEKVLDPKVANLSNDEILDAFYTKRTHNTNVWGKIYKTDLCKNVFSYIEDFHCFVGEDIFQFFYYAYFANTFAAVNTKKLYWYRYGLGVGNTSAMTTQKYELYCKMRSLCDRIEQFLIQKNSFALCMEPYKALVKRMLEDCCRIYTNRIDTDDKEEAAKLLVKYWRNVPNSHELLEKTLGMSIKDFMEKFHTVPVYVRENTAYAASESLPKVSVIIPAFEVEDYLRECVDSVITQTLDEIEIILVNDGSTDNSLAIMESYAESDQRVTLVSQKNGGQSVARNVALEYAHGEFIYFLDSDDYILPETLEKLYGFASKNTVDVLYFGGDSFFENERLEKEHASYLNYYHRDKKVSNQIMRGEDMFHHLLDMHLFRCSVPMQFIRHDLLKRTQIRFYEGIIHEDELFSPLVLVNAERAACITDRLYMRRVRAESTMTSPQITAKRFRGKMIVAVNLFAEAICSKPLSPIGRLALSEQARTMLASSARESQKLSPNDYARAINDFPEEYRFLLKDVRNTRFVATETVVKAAASVASKDNANAANIATIQLLNAEVNKLKTEIELMNGSLSMRIGRFVTFVPRKVRGVIRCYKENGLRYTLRLVAKILFKGK